MGHGQTLEVPSTLYIITYTFIDCIYNKIYNILYIHFYLSLVYYLNLTDLQFYASYHLEQGTHPLILKRHNNFYIILQCYIYLNIKKQILLIKKNKKCRYLKTLFFIILKKKNELNEYIHCIVKFNLNTLAHQMNTYVYILIIVVFSFVKIDGDHPQLLTVAHCCIGLQVIFESKQLKKQMSLCCIKIKFKPFF